MIVVPEGYKLRPGVNQSDYRRRKIRSNPNVWYVVTPDPTKIHEEESWHIVIEGGRWNQLVGKYACINFIDGGKTIDYKFQIQWHPTLETEMKTHEDRTEESKDFDNLIREILIDWLRFAHKSGMVKYAPLTEEMRDKGIYAVDVQMNPEDLPPDGHSGRVA